jgi:hypothetical protein
MLLELSLFILITGLYAVIFIILRIDFYKTVKESLETLDYLQKHERERLEKEHSKAHGANSDDQLPAHDTNGN